MMSSGIQKLGLPCGVLDSLSPACVKIQFFPCAMVHSGKALEQDPISMDRRASYKPFLQSLRLGPLGKNLPGTLRELSLPMSSQISNLQPNKKGLFIYLFIHISYWWSFPVLTCCLLQPCLLVSAQLHPLPAPSYSFLCCHDPLTPFPFLPAYLIPPLNKPFPQKVALACCLLPSHCSLCSCVTISSPVHLALSI